VAEVEEFAFSVLGRVGKDGWDLAVVFCGDDEMSALNKTWRGKDEATDVLSFPDGEAFEEGGERRVNAGDIVISTETLKANAAYFSVEETTELRRLIIHGILHLAGYDHETNDASEPMLELQEKILADRGDKK
jgi:probable rRNA maturation factor